MNSGIKRLRIDDPVGAVGAHAGAAVWGVLAVGLFADGELLGVEVATGLFRGGGFKLLGLQTLEGVAIMAWSFACTAPFFYLVGVLLSRKWRDPRIGLRLGRDEELEGEDKVIHGIHLPYDQSIRFAVGDSDDDSDGSQQNGPNELQHRKSVAGLPVRAAAAEAIRGLDPSNDRPLMKRVSRQFRRERRAGSSKQSRKFRGILGYGGSLGESSGSLRSTERCSSAEVGSNLKKGTKSVQFVALEVVDGDGDGDGDDMHR